MTTIAERIKKIRENELANLGIYAYKASQVCRIYANIDILP